MQRENALLIILINFECQKLHTPFTRLQIRRSFIDFEGAAPPRRRDTRSKMNFPCYSSFYYSAALLSRIIIILSRRQGSWVW